MQSPHRYHVCLYVGSNPPVLEKMNVVNLTPAEATPEAVLEAIASSGVKPTDLRAQVVFAADGQSPEDVRKAVLTYAALLGFANRRLDIRTGEDSLNVEQLDLALRSLPDAGRLDPKPDHVQVGAPHPEIPSVVISGAPSPADVSTIRYARRVRLVPTGSVTDALTQLVWVAAVRARDSVDRFPFLVEGDEPLVTESSEIVGICLDTLRRDALALRRSLRSDDRDSLAERVELSERQRTLLEAAARPIEHTLTALGAVSVERPAQSEDAPAEVLWHCPRPERHTHGDATPSMRVTRGKVRCFVCDAERVDSLRLVMDARSLSADEAAEWILAEVAEGEAIDVEATSVEASPAPQPTA